MSKHIFYTLYKYKPAYVLLGWNKSMCGYLMVIDYLNSPKPSPLFSHMFLKEPYPNSIDPLLHALEKEFKLSVPDEMVLEILQDAKVKESVDKKEVIHALINNCHQREEGVIDTINGRVVRIKAPKIQQRLMTPVIIE